MNLTVVLVRTENTANLGGTVRAMANMGVRRLVLIDPRCEITERSRETAAGARADFDRIIIYPDWKEFYAREGEGLRFAFTRRAGRKRQVFEFKEKLDFLAGPENVPVYLIFGPEADGLNSDDLAFANYCVHLPVFGEFGSYNLSHAVLLALYMVRERFPPAEKSAQVKGEIVESMRPFYFPDELIRRWLAAMGFDVRARRSSAFLTLRRLFLQNRPTRHEIQVLEAILQQNIRKLETGSDSVGFALEKLTDDLGDIAGKEI